MWRTDGDIEIYGYIENEEERDFCEDDPNVVWALVFFHLCRKWTFLKDLNSMKSFKLAVFQA